MPQWGRARRAGRSSGAAGTFQQRTELTPAQRDIYTTLQLNPPKKIIELAAPRD